MAAAVVVGLGLVLLAGHNLPYTGVWYDEAIQFWISRAVSPFATPFSVPGGLGDVLSLNASFNLDPGGFSVLLHYWLSVDGGIVWLRLLPYLFFLTALACLGWLAYTWTRSPLHALVSVSLVLLFDILLYHAVEIRAYSMEFAGVMALLLGCRFALQDKSPARFFALGIVAALFLGSRYSFVFPVTALGLTLIVFLARDTGRPVADRVALLAWFAVPVIVAAGLILQFSLRGQIDTWMGGSLVDQGAPDYVRHAVLAGKSLAESIDLAARNLLSWKGMPLTLAALLGAIVMVQRLAGRRFGRSVTVFSDSEKQTLVLVTFTLGISIAVSALGFYPWDIDSKWSQYLLALSPVCLALAAGVCWRLAHARGGLARAGALGAMGLVVALGSLNAMRYRHVYWLDLRAPLVYLSAVAENHSRVAVWGYEEPTVKYLYEFGPLRNEAIYPAGFHFMAWQPDADGTCLRYVLSPRPRQELEETFTGIDLQEDPAYPRVLRRVVPPGPRCPQPGRAGS